MPETRKHTANHPDIASPGHNCWRVAQADQFSWLIDGAEYFCALREAILKARHEVLLLAWDLDSRLVLLRDDIPGADDEAPDTLRELLDYVARENGVRVRGLLWDYAMIYAAEREWLPEYRLNKTTHPNVSILPDGQHPTGASHHQKVVVIDNQIAFCGGLDLTRCRWDTREHRPNDKRRTTAGNKPYDAFHDVQALVSGPAAQALGDLVRERWRQTTDSALSHPASHQINLWPDTVPVHIRNIPVAIARTQARWRDRPAIAEVEHAWLDMIGAARDVIYIENQYLTSHSIGSALADRLGEEDGPEIVIITPKDASGWLEQQTMGVLRTRLLKRLRNADNHDRLRVWYPWNQEGVHGTSINVHAKLMVVDNDILRIGSSNLSNRSMGLDTECDVTAFAQTDQHRTDIARFRYDLLAEHLGCDEGTVKRAHSEQGSLVAAIESLNGGDRCLRSVEPEIPRELDLAVPESTLIDPEKPLARDDLIRLFVSDKENQPARKRLGRFLLLVAVLVVMGIAWRWTPLSEWLSPERLIAAASAISDTVWAGPLTCLVFILGGLLMFPVTVLITATVMLFGGWEGVFWTLTGALSGASAGYGVGHLLGRKTLSRFAGPRVRQISNKLRKKGIFAVIIVRIIPVAPFTLINLLSGAIGISFRHYLLGTFMGMAPGIVGISMITDRLMAFIRDPDPQNFMLLGGVAVIVVVALMLLQRWLSKSRA